VRHNGFNTLLSITKTKWHWPERLPHRLAEGLLSIAQTQAEAPAPPQAKNLALFSAFKRSEFLLDAPNLVFHRLVPVRPGSESHAGGNSRHTRGMQGFMALLHGGEDSVPIALYVGAVRVKVGIESCRLEDALTNCDLPGNRDSDADRNNAQVCNDFHSPIVIEV
jgi:hypothetical protein